ncbi:MAG: hypothetical protein Q4B28_06815 [bacterium]|nr:hypothetical protein [bacterium]
MIDKLATRFIEKYFSEPDLKITLYWVEVESDELSYNLYINEYYFPLDVIYTALWYDVDEEVLFERYDQWSDPRNQTKRNLKNFIAQRK